MVADYRTVLRRSPRVFNAYDWSIERLVDLGGLHAFRVRRRYLGKLFPPGRVSLR